MARKVGRRAQTAISGDPSTHDRLEDPPARAALSVPAEKEGVKYDEAAIREIFHALDHEPWIET